MSAGGHLPLGNVFASTLPLLPGCASPLDSMPDPNSVAWMGEYVEAPEERPLALRGLLSPESLFSLCRLVWVRLVFTSLLTLLSVPTFLLYYWYLRFL